MKTLRELESKAECIRGAIEKVENSGVIDGAASVAGLMFVAYGVNMITYSPEEMAKKAGMLISTLAISTAVFGAVAFIHRIRQRTSLKSEERRLWNKLSLA